ncbi:MAG: efflux RND transporter periplasmic adaptor subunit [Pseudomonadota bacterium]
MRMQIAVTVVLAAFVAGGWLALSRWEGDAKQRDRGKRVKATIVMVEPLATAKDQLSLRVVGTGEALRSASIYPTVSGEVTEILFRADQQVERGAPLLHLDDKHEKLAVRLAEVALQEAERQANRLKKLAPTGSVPMARLETAVTELESASVRLEQAQANLADRTVRAPFEGVIGLTKLDVGDRVTDETMVATLDDRSVILVEFVVPEEYAAKIALGDTIEVRPWMDQDRVLEGRIAAIDSRIDQATRSLTVQAQIPNPDESIKPGTAFDVRLSFVGKLFPVVEEVAVSWSGDGAYLWRVVNGKAEKVFVKLVRRDEGKILVDGPLKVGDLIVVEGVQGLRDGQSLDARPARGSGTGDAISKIGKQESGTGG